MPDLVLNTPRSRGSFYKDVIERLLNKADILVNGSRPWDIQINDSRFYRTAFRQGSLGFGKSYVDGIWDCPAPDQLIFRVLEADLPQYVSWGWKSVLYNLQSRLVNMQTRAKARKSIHAHYDIGNDLFKMMLDRRMIYSCAYWKDAHSLEDAQDRKLDLICRKLKLTEGEHLLDIGCGWGGLAAYAAEKYGVKVTGVTISSEQAILARERCRGLPVTILLEDYRSIKGRFDKVVSVGMFEHVGYKNYASFMALVDKVLQPSGLFLLHTIGGNSSTAYIDPWINLYIFPNGMMPSVRQIGKSMEGRFIVEDWHNFGPYYDLTLMEWMSRFKNGWPMLKQSYSEKFYRTWIYYLSCSAASFRSKNNNLWQIVLSKTSNRTFYESVR